jgi:CubicO group peptidase (beta-lactamase class C family)
MTGQDFPLQEVPLHRRSRPRIVLVLLLGFVLLAHRVQAAGPDAGSAPVQAALAPLIDAVQASIKGGQVVGAQLGAGGREGLLEERCFGTIAPGAARPVDDATLFGIGSCSKPFAAACVLTLVADGTLTLDEPIDRWLPAFGDLGLKSGGKAPRAPTLRELLAHRGGIYSQRERLTTRQIRLIRDFRLTLAESVDGIAGEPLIAPPGERFAYSGAGYCVLGRVAEVAARSDFEALFHTRIARPLGLKRTTYLPRPVDANIAVSTVPNQAQDRPALGPAAPHMLGKLHRLTLVGGSLYSTAHETGQFARMILNQGRSGTATVLPDSAWKELVHRQFPGQNYGLGWTLEFAAGDSASILTHTGALFSHRSLLMIDRAGGCYVAAHWTIARRAPDEDEDDPGDSIIPAARAALRSLATLTRPS